MSKVSRDATLEKGEALLHSWGVDRSSPIELLAEQLGRDPVADLAIARWLGDRGDPRALDLLEQLAHSEVSKAVRREARRSLYRLQQRGLVQAEKPREIVARPLLGTESEATQAFYGPYGVDGSRALLLARKHPGRWIVLLAETEHYDARLGKLDRIEVRSKLWRKLLDDWSTGQDAFVRGDKQYCDFLLWQAYQSLPPSARTPERDYPASRAEFFSSPPPETMESPILCLYPPEGIGAFSNGAPQLDLKELLSRPVVVHLVAATSRRMGPFVEQVLALEQSPLVLSEAVKQERRLQIEEQALREIFVEERPSWVHRLREIAYYCHLRGDTGAARSLAQFALALEKADMEPQHLAFCRDLTRLALSLALGRHQEEEEQRAQESLVLTPQQLRQARKLPPKPGR